jgi:type I restriction enzyme S subunit
MRREISRRASGTSGSMKNIGKEKVLSISIGVPPIGERKRFEQAVRQIGGAFQTVEGAVTQADTLFTSLLHRAFRGEL